MVCGTLEMKFSYGLKCMFYKIFEKLSSKTMKTATSVCTIQCRIAINVGLVEFLWLYGMPLFYWIYFTVQLERTLES